jgi:hypothetical protein
MIDEEETRRIHHRSDCQNEPRIAFFRDVLLGLFWSGIQPFVMTSGPSKARINNKKSKNENNPLLIASTSQTSFCGRYKS